MLLAGGLCAFPALLCGFPNQTKHQPGATASENQNPPVQQISHRPNTSRPSLCRFDGLFRGVKKLILQLQDSVVLLDLTDHRGQLIDILF